MTIEDRIIFDYKDLKQYFLKKFELLEESIIKENTLDYQIYNDNSKIIDASFAQISHLIKPDIIINIYSYFEFWAKLICQLYEYEIKQKKHESFIDALKRCLENNMQINIKSLDHYFKDIKLLSNIRNIYIHRGGHPKTDEMEKWKHLALLGANNMILLDEKQIYKWLEEAKDLLVAIVEQVKLK